MRDPTNRAVFVAMLREEWRIHNQVFDGARFLLFPVLVALLTGVTTHLLLLTGTEPGTVLVGLFALVFIFGLHTGSIGLVGRDALEGLFGDLTLIVFSGRTLPLSHRRLLGIFVVKDVLYYALLFLAPISLGFLPIYLHTGDPVVDVGIGIMGLFLTLTATFVLGIGVTIAGLGLSSRGAPTRVLLVVFVALGIGAWYANLPLTWMTPYGVFVDPGLVNVLGSTALIVAVYGLGVATFQVTRRRRVETYDPVYRGWHRRLGDPLTTRTLLELHRSSGGVWKVFLSAGILLVVTVGIVELAGRITGVPPSVGISFGAILGLSAFTTYNWLTQFDDVDSYMIHAHDIAGVFRAKFRAFVLVGPIVGLGMLGVGYLWRGNGILEGIAGGVVLVGISFYIFGVTARLTGLVPNELLFDTARFLLFGIAIAIPLIPLMLIAFLVPTSGPWILAATAGFALLLGAVGLGLYHVSIPHWTTVMRN